MRPTEQTNDKYIAIAMNKTSKWISKQKLQWALRVMVYVCFFSSSPSRKPRVDRCFVYSMRKEQNTRTNTHTSASECTFSVLLLFFSCRCCCCGWIWSNTHWRISIHRLSKHKHSTDGYDLKSTTLLFFFILSLRLFIRWNFFGANRGGFLPNILILFNFNAIFLFLPAIAFASHLYVCTISHINTAFLVHAVWTYVCMRLHVFRCCVGHDIVRACSHFCGYYLISMTQNINVRLLPFIAFMRNGSCRWQSNKILSKQSKKKTTATTIPYSKFIYMLLFFRFLGVTHLVALPYRWAAVCPK